MIDRVSPCWTRNLSGHNNLGAGNNKVNPLSITTVNSSSPSSSSILTMESLDSLEGFESETGFCTISSRPCLAELMGGSSQISPGHHGQLTSGGHNNNSTPMSLTHSSALHPHMSPSHHETDPSTPTSASTNVTYGMVPNDMGGLGQQQVHGNQGPLPNSQSNGGVNVPEYPWMKEKKTTRKNSHQGNSKLDNFNFLLLPKIVGIAAVQIFLFKYLFKM